jgi:hypothetical protein
MHPNSTTGQARRRTQHAPDAYLMDWTAENLPSCESFFITDLDMVVRDRKGNMLIAEVKRRSATMTPQQRTTYELISELIKEGIKANPDGIIVPSMRYPVKVNYLGVHLLQFENTTFEDGQIFWDKTPISTEQLKGILSFEISPFF